MEFKLTGLISALLIAVLAALSVAGHGRLESVLFSSAEERLKSVSVLLVSLLDQSVRQRQAETGRLAGHPAVRAYLAAPDATRREAARIAVDSLLPSSQQLIAVEVRAPSGECLLALTAREGSADDAAGDGRPGPAADCVGTPGPPGSALPRGYGPIREAGERLVYEVVAPVPASEGRESDRSAPADTLGFVMQRRLVSSESSAELIRDLIGSDARFLVGNLEGDLWSDLAGKVEPPRIDATRSGIQRYRGAGDSVRRLGLATPLNDAPWALWVEFPERAVLAPIAGFHRGMAVTTLALLVLGAVGARFISRRITRPVRAITGAAIDMSAGDYSRRVDVGDRGDELDRLAESFNTMAETVEDAHQRLEERVRERTEELQSTLVRLEQAQAELVRREKLALLGQLASGVGHELRNPLGVMTNALYYLQSVLTDVPEKVKEYLGILHTQIGLSEKIVNDLLDFARVKTPDRQRVALAEIVETQLDRVGMPDDVRVVREFPGDLPPTDVDPTQVGQVVLNLITNGIQAMEDGGGTLTLRGSADGADRIRLDVADTGVGIEPDTIERIFEPLFTTRARGIGLGLAVAQVLARANDGELTAESRPGVGSTFTLSLPLESARAAS